MDFKKDILILKEYSFGVFWWNHVLKWLGFTTLPKLDQANEFNKTEMLAARASSAGETAMCKLFVFLV